MQPPAVRLEREGYAVVNAGYPWHRRTIEELAGGCIPPAVRFLEGQGADPIHFVTHSMGGLLVRSYLATRPQMSLGRVVMLCPPNRGSELVDFFGRFCWFRLLYGPAGCQLRTGPADLPTRLGPVDYPVGIITGDRPATPLFGRFFRGANDGKVSVASARIEGMADFLVLPYGHSLLMNHRAVLDQMAHFLTAGCFLR
jgi:pimeloyl-ACP methyl ester carboxylesterase